MHDVDMLIDRIRELESELSSMSTPLNGTDTAGDLPPLMLRVEPRFDGKGIYMHVDSSEGEAYGGMSVDEAEALISSLRRNLDALPDY